MAAYELESQRALLEDFERTLRVAAAGVREHERFPLRSKRSIREGKGSVRNEDSFFVDVDGEAMINSSRDAELVTRMLIDLAADQIRSIRARGREEGIEFAKELKQLSGDGNVDSAKKLFYERLQVLQSTFEGSSAEEYALTSGQLDRQVGMAAVPSATFTGEEAGGKYLDLHEAHSIFINLKGVDPEHYDYMTYVSTFHSFDALTDDTKSRPQYKSYLDSVVQYLTGFCDRIFPLKFVEEQLHKVGDKAVEEMERESKSVVDWSEYDSAKAMLEGETADSLKEALKKLGLKCGGTPLQRAERLFTATVRNGADVNGGTNSLDAKAAYKRECRVLEAKIGYLVEEVLSDIVQNTRVNIEKKLALSYEELEAERMADEAPQAAASEGEESDSGEEKPIYNPKDVPLGWDGKPIPYWLYKLHGLNHEFKCEVCGDITYRGPRNFERHFSEARHTHNLKMLGIQYSRYFYMVTKISDALHLAKKSQEESTTEQFRAEDEEEYEDADGNVFNRKTYEDLKRQGLL